MTSPEASNLLVEVDSSGVATLTLNRPKVHNAFDEALIEDAVELISGLRVSPEGREGIAAFLEKRAPVWCG